MWLLSLSRPSQLDPRSPMFLLLFFLSLSQPHLTLAGSPASSAATALRQPAPCQGARNPRTGVCQTFAECPCYLLFYDKNDNATLELGKWGSSTTELGHGLRYHLPERLELLQATYDRHCAATCPNVKFSHLFADHPALSGQHQRLRSPKATTKVVGGSLPSKYDPLRLSLYQLLDPPKNSWLAVQAWIRWVILSEGRKVCNECRCGPRREGLLCSSLQLCSPNNRKQRNPCHPMAICLDSSTSSSPTATTTSGGNISCLCPPGRSGSTCQFITDGCQNWSCRNKGKCIPLGHMGVCQCPRNFTGLHCELGLVPFNASSQAALEGYATSWITIYLGSTLDSYFRRGLSWIQESTQTFQTKTILLCASCTFFGLNLILFFCLRHSDSYCLRFLTDCCGCNGNLSSSANSVHSQANSKAPLQHYQSLSVERVSKQMSIMTPFWKEMFQK